MKYCENRDISANPIFISLRRYTVVSTCNFIFYYSFKVQWLL